MASCVVCARQPRHTAPSRRCKGCMVGAMLPCGYCYWLHDLPPKTRGRNRRSSTLLLEPIFVTKHPRYALNIGDCSSPCLRFSCKIPAKYLQVAPQLTVVSAPSFNQALERMRGTPSRRGWRPTRRWHMKRQQFPDRPALIRDARGHRRGGPATGVGQTRMGCAKIIDRAHQEHPLVQRQGLAGQCPAPARQRCEVFTE